MNLPTDADLRRYLVDCEPRTLAESAARVGRADSPRNFHIPPKGSDRGDVIAPRHNRMLRR